MYIQKKKNAYYLKTSIWSPERQRSTTVSKYLGSGFAAAMANLKSEVSDYDYLDLRDKLLQSTIRTPCEILQDLQSKFSQIEILLSELETTATPTTLKQIDKIRKSHTGLLAQIPTPAEPKNSKNQVELF